MILVWCVYVIVFVKSFMNAAMLLKHNAAIPPVISLWIGRGSWKIAFILEVTWMAILVGNLIYYPPPTKC